MKNVASRLLAAFVICVPLTAHSSEPTAESRQLARSTPIFDMHMHVYPGLTPAELEARMDRNGVQWGGGVGALSPKVDIAPFKAHLRGRYYPTLAQPEMAASFSQGGAAAMSNPENPLIRRSLERARFLFPRGEAFGFGELILYNQNSAASPSFRRQARVDSPPVRQMFEIADEHGLFIQIHIEAQAGPLNQLKQLMTAFPKVSVVLSHCLAMTSGPREMEILFDAFPQVHCELSARSQTVLTGPDAYAQVYGFGFAKPEWVKSIEKYPDRYMVGTDATSDAVNYDAEVRQIREGLFPRLTPDTLAKVAHLNAKRLVRLKD
jgi:predicted TIM-barrel fold metal-dependent hydrolase